MQEHQVLPESNMTVLNTAVTSFKTLCPQASSVTAPSLGGDKEENLVMNYEELTSGKILVF